MKKIIFAIACLACTMSATAQRASSSTTSFFSTERSDAPIAFTIRAGLNFANMTMKEGNHSYTPDSRTAFNVGLAVDFPLIESLYLQSGLFFTSKGFKEKDGDEKYTASPNYLQIPILASYRLDFSDIAQLQVNVGPYIAYGIGGKSTWEDDDEGKVERDFFEDDINKFDAGLQIGAGVTFAQHYYLGVAYEWGWTNIWKDAGDDKLKNKNLMINIGYTF